MRRLISFTLTCALHTLAACAEASEARTAEAGQSDCGDERGASPAVELRNHLDTVIVPEDFGALGWFLRKLAPDAELADWTIRYTPDGPLPGTVSPEQRQIEVRAHPDRAAPGEFEADSVAWRSEKVRVMQALLTRSAQTYFDSPYADDLLRNFCYTPAERAADGPDEDLREAHLHDLKLIISELRVRWPLALYAHQLGLNIDELKLSEQDPIDSKTMEWMRVAAWQVPTPTPADAGWPDALIDGVEELVEELRPSLQLPRHGGDAAEFWTRPSNRTSQDTKSAFWYVRLNPVFWFSTEVKSFWALKDHPNESYDD